MSSTDARPSAGATARTLPAAVLVMLFRSLGVLAVLAVPVVSGLGQAGGGSSEARPEQVESSVWKDAYSERYPGCVPSVLWPADERPAALLARGPDGRIHKVTVDDRRSPVRGLPDGAFAIGICR